MVVGCSQEASGPVVVSVIGTAADFAKPLENLPDPGAKLLLEATAQGRVEGDGERCRAPTDGTDRGAAAA